MGGGELSSSSAAAAAAAAAAKENDHERSESTLYTRRWLMLALFCATTAANQGTWITYAPEAPVFISFYDVSAMAINALSMVYMLVFIPGAPFASYIVRLLSLRSAISIGAVLNGFGALIRVLPYPFTDGGGRSGYACALTGQALGACAQAFLMAMPPALAQNWFGESERGTATGIASVAMQGGVAIGMLLPSWVINGENASHVPRLMILEAILSLVPALLLLVLFRSRPPTPPSQSARVQWSMEEGTQPISERASVNSNDATSPAGQGSLVAMRALFNNTQVLLLAIGFGAVFGTLYCVATVMGQAFESIELESWVAGWAGMSMTASGAVGAFLWGIATDKTKRYKLLIIIASGGTLIGMMLNAVCVSSPSDWSNFLLSPAMIITVLTFTGFFMTALLPVCFEAGVETTYPLAPEWASNMLMVSAQCFGIAEIIVVTIVLEYSIPSAYWGMCGTILFSCIMFAIARITPLRQMEDQRHVKGGEVSSSPH